jgi:hypothetical protein
MGVAVKSDQTLASFKEEVLEKYGFGLSDYTLILIGRELKDDTKTLGDLGFIPGCTVHAGKLFPVNSQPEPLVILRCSCQSAILCIDSNSG